MRTPTPAEINKRNRQGLATYKALAEQGAAEAAPADAGEETDSRLTSAAPSSVLTDDGPTKPHVPGSFAPSENLPATDPELAARRGAAAARVRHVRVGLEEAFAELPVLPGKEQELRVVLGQLVAVALDVKAPRQKAAFRDVSRTTAENELVILAKRAGALANLIEGENLHQPTVLALAGEGVMRHELESLLPALHRITKAAKAAQPDDAPAVAEGGRPLDEHARLVTRILHHNFEKLTGRHPSRLVNRMAKGHPACGPFHDLVATVFAALGMKASPAAWVKEVMEEARRGRRGKKKTPKN